jgi:hypothetical protein
MTKIQKIEPCGAVGKCMSSPASYANGMSSYRTPSPDAVAKRALSELAAARERDIATHQANLPAIEANKAIHARVEALMSEIGMPARFTQRDLNSRARTPKSITSPAGYLTDLAREAKIDDGFAAATQTYGRLLLDYKAFAERADREAAEKARQAEIEQNRMIQQRKADMELAGILLRYELQIDSTWDDVLTELRKRDQRLDLAVAMQQTRGDWSDGPYRVRDALDRFTIATTEDKDIANDVLSGLEDFSDGRVFRDMRWNYDALFASVPDRQLAADVQLAASRLIA